MKFPSQKWLFYACLVLSGFAVAVILSQLTHQIGSKSNSVTVKGIFSSLQPIIVGIIMTYLLYPLTSKFESYLLYHRTRKKLARITSVALAAIVMLTLFFLFGYLILPELISSITTLSKNLSSMLNDFISNLSKFLENYGLPSETITKQWEKASAKFMVWLEQDIVKTLLSITSGLFSIAKVALNLVIGIIVMVYLLYSRDHFIGQSKKLLYAVCRNRKTCASILKNVRQINLIFGGFLTGKVIDSLIIGVICFISLSVLQIPYPLIISLVIGITNIIPVFGPFIGAVPSAFLLLLSDPTKCLVFIIFIIILQQVDGNVIGPMILGDSTGLPAFWVLFSLLLFQYLMGFWGLLLGVPLFASIYYLLRQLVNHLLVKRNLPTSTAAYMSVQEFSEDGTPVPLIPSRKKSFFRYNKHNPSTKSSGSDSDQSS